MNVNKDILAFFWLRFVMWFYFIFHGMTTILQRSHYVSRDFTLSDWPVDIERLKKLKWWPINPGSIETWNSIQFDKVCQLLATGRWFSPGPPASSTNITDRHDITEILLNIFNEVQ
jgi:hypothetical protein